MCQERNKRKRTVVGPSEGESAPWEKQLESIVYQEDVFKEEAAYPAERGISDCPATAGTVRSNRSTYGIMQAVKKLVLVDEFDREYKRLQKPAQKSISLYLNVFDDWVRRGKRNTFESAKKNL